MLEADVSKEVRPGLLSSRKWFEPRDYEAYLMNRQKCLGKAG